VGYEKVPENYSCGLGKPLIFGE